MKWMIYILIAAIVAAHYYAEYRRIQQRENEDSMHFTIEMSKNHPIFIHPLQSEGQMNDTTIVEKKCTKCEEVKLLNEFPKRKLSKDGREGKCRQCTKKYHSLWRRGNPDKVKKAQKRSRQNCKLQRRIYNSEYAKRTRYAAQIAWAKRNPDKTKIIKKRFRNLHADKCKSDKLRWNKANPEKLKKMKRESRLRNLEASTLRDKIYREKNRDAVRLRKKKYHARKYRESPEYRIKIYLRGRLGGAMRKFRNGRTKTREAVDLLGCTVEEFRAYIETLWIEGMSWANYGRKGWHLDHKIAVSRFDLKKLSHRKACFHYSNFQPLWMPDNIKKSNLITVEQEEFIRGLPDDSAVSNVAI
jgi:hypothetical protein